MSHSAVFLFLLVALTGIAIVHGHELRKCKGLRHKGFGGRCFATAKRLRGYNPSPTACPSLLLPGQDTGCKRPDQGCCINCGRQNNTCDRAFGKSVARAHVCCPYVYSKELEIGVVRPGSGCICCKVCKPKRTCRRGKYKGHCITADDPVYNVQWCQDKPGWKIYKKRCTGWGCWCCTWDH